MRTVSPKHHPSTNQAWNRGEIRVVKDGLQLPTTQAFSDVTSH